MIPNRKILIVDRDPDMVTLVAASLRRKVRGLEIVEATSGAQALDRLAESPMPGLVITSLRLPQISGAELARAVVEQDLKAKVVLYTGDPAAARIELGDHKARVFDKLNGLEALIEYVKGMVPRAA